CFKTGLGREGEAPAEPELCVNSMILAASGSAGASPSRPPADSTKFRQRINAPLLRRPALELWEHRAQGDSHYPLDKEVNVIVDLGGVAHFGSAVGGCKSPHGLTGPVAKLHGQQNRDAGVGP